MHIALSRTFQWHQKQSGGEGEGDGGSPRFGRVMTWSHPNKQTNKQTPIFIHSLTYPEIVNLYGLLPRFHKFSFTYSLLEFQTLGPSLPHTTPPYLGLHQSLPHTTYRVNYSTIPTHKHEQVDYITYRVNYIPPFPPPINMNKLTIQHVELTILTHKHEQVDSTKQDTITMTPLKIVGQSKTIISLYGPTWRALHCGLILQDSKWVSHSWTRVLHPKHNNIQALWLMWVEILHTSLESMASSKRKYGFLVPLVCMYVCTKDTNQNLTTRSSMHPGKQDYNGQALKEWCLLSFFCEIFYHICMPTRS